MRALLAVLLVALLCVVFEHVAEGFVRFIIIMTVLMAVLAGMSLSEPRKTKYVYLRQKVQFNIEPITLPPLSDPSPLINALRTSLERGERPTRATGLVGVDQKKSL